MEVATAIIASPVGRLRVEGDAQGVSGIVFTKEQESTKVPPQLRPFVAQLRAYFAGKAVSGRSLAFHLKGTEFQQRVWNALLRVPYGETVTYKALAERVGHPGAHRAVGTAVGKNPLSVVIPCHRVVPSSGGIGQYAWGSAKKKWLLEHEARSTQNPYFVILASYFSLIPPR